MPLRLYALALLTAATTFTGATAHAGGLNPNLNIPVNGAVMTGRHPVIGYGPSFAPQPNYGGLNRQRCGTAKFDPSSQFEGCTDNFSPGNISLKPPK